MVAALTCVAPSVSFGELVSMVLPNSPSVQVGTTATPFAIVINIGPGTATNCSMSPATSIPAAFLYQTTDPVTNAPVGAPNTSVDIAEGTSQGFVNLNTESLLVNVTALLDKLQHMFSLRCWNRSIGKPLFV